MRLASLFGIAAFALIAGCSHDSGPAVGASTSSGGTASPGIVGKWKVDPEVVKSAPKDQAAFMTGFASTFWYEFKADKTFTGSMSEGTYTLDNGKLAMLTTKQIGTETHATVPQMTGDLNGSKLILHPTASGILPEFLQKGIAMAKEK